MKYFFILLLIPLIGYTQKDDDTTLQMIYYQKTLLKKGKIEIYGYSSYDLYWWDESGIGIIYTITNKRKKYKRKTYVDNRWNK